MQETRWIKREIFEVESLKKYFQVKRTPIIFLHLRKIIFQSVNGSLY